MLVLEKYELYYEEFKVNYPIVYEMLLSMLNAYGISTDEFYYKYLNAEYDLNDAMLKVFGVLNQELSLELIINWCLSTIATKDYEHILQAKRKSKENYNILSEVIRETFFLNELEFLSLVVNILWKHDLNEYGYITHENFILYNNCTLILC